MLCMECDEQFKSFFKIFDPLVKGALIRAANSVTTMLRRITAVQSFNVTTQQLRGSNIQGRILKI